MTARAMRFWGWGEPPRPPSLSEAGLRLLRSEAGLGTRETRPVALDDVRLPDVELPGTVAERLRAIVGDEHVRGDRSVRVAHAAGKGYADLIRMRAGDGSGAPDAVVSPGSAAEVAEVLAICGEQGVAVVPFGGGTSVVGGVEALRGGFESVISLDLARLDALAVDRESLTAKFGAGLRGPRAEARLNGRGLTLGHFPQSFEFATIGGYVATRSAGQASTGYGRIDELVLGLSCATPSGELVAKTVPASAAGPSLLQLVVGSEGTLGVITEATLAVRPLPEERRHEGWWFRSFDDGIEAFRALEQAHASPDVARLSDREETRVALAMASSGSISDRIGRLFLRARGAELGSLAIVGWDGEPSEIAARAQRTRMILKDGDAISLGRRPGEAWLRSRYDGPYLRDVLLDHAMSVETFETATTWRNLRPLHRAVRDAVSDALERRGTPGIVGCHVSHLYPSGASLYYTWIAPQQQGEELDQWRATKAAACDAIVENGGTLTHHHAVGSDHAPWLPREIGDLGVETLKAAKRTLDPTGIMNPGKLFI